MTADIEPLSPDIWFERIEMIANGGLACTESALRHALHLLQLTPPEFRPREHQSIDESAYEALLETGRLDEAARSLVAAPTLSVSATSAPSGVEVAIRCRTLGRTIIGKGDSVASATLQAWALCLLALRSALETGAFKKVYGF